MNNYKVMFFVEGKRVLHSDYATLWKAQRMARVLGDIHGSDMVEIHFRGKLRPGAAKVWRWVDDARALTVSWVVVEKQGSEPLNLFGD